MNILQHESENAKVVLCEPKLNDRTENQLQKQAWIRIPDLPDESTYGKLITQELIGDIFQTKLQEIIQNVEEVRKNQMISQILLKGKSINIPRFIKKVHSEIGDKYGIEIVNLEEAVKDSKFGVNS